MGLIDSDITKIEAATSGKDIREYIVSALNKLNNNINPVTYTGIPTATITKIFTR